MYAFTSLFSVYISDIVGSMQDTVSMPHKHGKQGIDIILQ